MLAGGGGHLLVSLSLLYSCLCASTALPGAAAGAGFSAVPRPQAVAALHWLSRFAALWSWNAAMEDVTSDAIGALVAADDELWL